MTDSHIPIVAILVVSVAIQTWAAITAVRLIRVTGSRAAWSLIAVALALMAVRRAVPLYRLFSENVAHPPDMASELVALAISIIMAAGLSFIAPLFRERQRIEGELRKASSEIQNLYEHAPCGYHSLDNEGVFIRMNATELQWLGYARDEVLGKMRFSNILTAASLDTFKANFPLFKERGWVRDLEFELVRKDGSTFPVLLNATAIYDDDGTYVMSRSTVYDVTERRRAEDQLRRLNRNLRAISLCNQALIRATDEQALLNEICSIICNTAGYRMAWVGYAEHDESSTIRPAAWAGIESGYIAEAKLSWSAATDRGRGPAGMAVRTGAGIYVQDFTTDQRMAPWRESALQRGYRSGMALPLMDEQVAAFGVLLIYSAAAYSVTAEEIRLMEELAGNLAFGISVLRTRTQRRQAEDDLKALNQELDQRVKERTADLERKTKELEKLNKLFVGRELRMAELKNQIRKLNKTRDEMGDTSA